MIGVDRFSTAPLVDVATAVHRSQRSRVHVQNSDQLRLENIALRQQLACVNSQIITIGGALI
jgi:hypothetical protein